PPRRRLETGDDAAPQGVEVPAQHAAGPPHGPVRELRDLLRSHHLTVEPPDDDAPRARPEIDGDVQVTAGGCAQLAHRGTSGDTTRLTRPNRPAAPRRARRRCARRSRTPRTPPSGRPAARAPRATRRARDARRYRRRP